MYPQKSDQCLIRTDDMAPDIGLRRFVDSDAPELAQIYFDAVHLGTNHHYSVEQRTAWVGLKPDPDFWLNRLRSLRTIVATRSNKPIGFMTIDNVGLIDLAFVAPSLAGTGVGKKLYDAIENEARKLGLK